MLLWDWAKLRHTSKYKREIIKKLSRFSCQTSFKCSFRTIVYDLNIILKFYNNAMI